MLAILEAGQTDYTALVDLTVHTVYYWVSFCYEFGADRLLFRFDFVVHEFLEF